MNRLKISEGRMEIPGDWEMKPDHTVHGLSSRRYRYGRTISFREIIRDFYESFLWFIERELEVDHILHSIERRTKEKCFCTQTLKVDFLLHFCVFVGDWWNSLLQGIARRKSCVSLYNLYGVEFVWTLFGSADFRD